jgi:flagellar basal-body rod protein FlgC
MYGALDISTSGMIAQRVRLTAISSNVANRHSVTADGTPYRAKLVHFAPGDKSATTREGRALGVHVREIEDDPRPFNYRYDPTHPMAAKEGPRQGYVAESNVNPIVEQINAMQAGRAYEANAVAAEATKTMISQALRLLA